MKINAQVVDLSTDTPKDSDNFFVDTNVWYWLSYTKASNPALSAKRYQIASYPAYTEKAFQAKSGIYSTGLNVSELIHLIERSEYDIYADKIAPIGRKKFRHELEKERSVVCNEINAACLQVLSLSKNIDISLTADTFQKVLPEIIYHKVDGYDLLNLKAMLGAEISQVVTDDGDFASAPGITVFTANRSIIDQAREQGKLVTR